MNRTEKNLQRARFDRGELVTVAEGVKATGLSERLLLSLPIHRECAEDGPVLLVRDCMNDWAWAVGAYDWFFDYWSDDGDDTAATGAQQYGAEEKGPTDAADDVQ